ncbi:uncharacterized protein LOC127717564 isoform X2 [Mytilus californianus]|uniref:uncharacterized protein LOC127717564 isoform X2 n=1 Tax=Mytilus californianus TaxID=6549 RepID=UPI0022450B0F|nr:uncharacterized protein LOC127717564 isoform X2 [Mytilus californianus]
MNTLFLYSIWIFTILTSIKCKVKDKPPDISDQYRNWDINDNPEVQSSIRVELLDNNIYRRSVSSKYDISLKFSLSSKPVILKLQQNAQLNSRIPVYVFAQNGSIIREDLHTDLHDVNYYYDTSNGASFYIESIDGLRSHMYGTFHLENEEYILEFKNNNSFVTHKESQQPKSIYHFKIWKTPSLKHKNLKDPIYTNIEKTFPEHRRKKRAPSYNVEVLFVVDYSIYKHWYDKNRGSSAKAIHSIRQIYAFVVNGMDGRYKSMSSNFIGIVFAGLIVSKTPSESEWTESLKQTHETPNLVNAHKALEKFQKWVQKQTDLPSNDHVMLLTRYSLSSLQSSSLQGYAYVGAICSQSSQSIMEESDDYSMITVAAHELGHSLGASHDGEGNSCRLDAYFIMAATNQPSMGNPNPWRFSSCSVDYFHQTIRRLDSKRKNCLTSFGPQYNPNEIVPYLSKLPGELYTADEQCQSRNGDKSSLCREQYKGDYRQMCGLMWCRDDKTQGCNSMVPADGTLCDSKHWCRNGVCTYSSAAASTPARCAHGDFVGSMDHLGNTCPQIVAKDKTECYRDRIGISCCASCAKVSSGVTETITRKRPRYRRTTVKQNYLPPTTPLKGLILTTTEYNKGCLYGDRIPSSLCNKTACPYYTKDELSHCCKTCSAYFNVPDPKSLPTESDGTTEILIGVSVAIVIIAVICGIYINRRGGYSGARHKIPLKGRSVQETHSRPSKPPLRKPLSSISNGDQNSNSTKHLISLPTLNSHTNVNLKSNLHKSASGNKSDSRTVNGNVKTSELRPPSKFSAKNNSEQSCLQNRNPINKQKRDQNLKKPKTSLSEDSILLSPKHKQNNIDKTELKSEISIKDRIAALSGNAESSNARADCVPKIKVNLSNDRPKTNAKPKTVFTKSEPEDTKIDNKFNKTPLRPPGRSGVEKSPSHLTQKGDTDFVTKSGKFQSRPPFGKTGGAYESSDGSSGKTSVDCNEPSQVPQYKPIVYGKQKSNTKNVNA